MSAELRLGQLVYSKAGRDKDKVFLIISLANEKFAYLVDGEKRKIESPKKKNIKHLLNTSIVAEPIAKKLQKGELLTNSEIKRAIAALVGEKNNTAGQGG